jgi:hypothetical protein
LDTSERADIELSRLIEKRHDPRDGDALLEPSYAASVRRYNATGEAESRRAWAAPCSHHLSQELRGVKR